MDIRGQLSKIGHDLTSGPDLSDMIEIALVGAAVGGAIGYAKERDKAGVKMGALWGVGLGVAGQYLLFHAMKPALRSHGLRPVAHRAGKHVAGAVNRGGFRGGSQMPFGPGPWPTNYASAPAENGQGTSRPTIMTDENGQLQMTGWGHGEMPAPFGYSDYAASMFGHGGGHGIEHW
jgi:hypothetical protein